MVTNKTNKPQRFHEIIKTKHVFIAPAHQQGGDIQVFMKRDIQESVLPDNHGEVWYPINFQWIPVITIQQNLERQPAPLNDGPKHQSK